MTNKSDQTIETILINTARKELAIIKLFCQAPFPADISSVVAVRMSRAIVFSICQMNTSSIEIGSKSSFFSEKGNLYLNELMAELEKSSKQFEAGLKKQSCSDLAWKTWIA